MIYGIYGRATNLKGCRNTTIRIKLVQKKLPFSTDTVIFENDCPRLFFTPLCFLWYFFLSECTIALNRNFNFFKRNNTFKALLPITGNVNYIETKSGLSQIECASSCVFCSRFLYNSGAGTCSLLKIRLVERSFNISRVNKGISRTIQQK